MRRRTDVRSLTLMLAALGGCAALLAGCSDELPRTRDPGDLTWPENAPKPGLGQGRIIITNNYSDTLSILDLETFDLMATLPVGQNPVDLEGPHHVYGDPQGRYYYTALSQSVSITGSGPHGAHGDATVDGYTLKYRASDNALLGVVRVDRNPGDVLVTSDGKTVVVSHYDLRRFQDALARQDPDPTAYDSAIAVIDADKMDLASQNRGLRALVKVCPAAHGMSFSLDERYLYVTCFLSDELAIVDLQDPELSVRRVPLTSDYRYEPGITYYEPYAAVTNPVDGKVWVSAWKTTELRVYDPETGAFDEERSVRLDGAPFFGAFSADGRRLYMAEQSSPDALVVVDAATFQVERRLTFSREQCVKAHQAAVLPDERRLVFLCEGNWPVENGTTLLIDIDRLLAGDGQDAILRWHEVGQYPDGLAIIQPPQ